jgi:beta-lactamase regulating signal transducer with metallopeptidase domain
MQAMFHVIDRAAASWLTLSIGVVPKSVCIPLIAAALWPFIRRRSAALRHLILNAALCGLFLVPLIAATTPPLRAPLVPRTPGMAEYVSDAPLPDSVGAGADMSNANVSGEASYTSDATGRQQVISSINNLRAGVFLVWMLGAVWVLLRFSLGVLTVRNLVRRSTPMDADAVNLSSILANVPRLRICLGGAIPLTYGWPRPVLVLPVDFMEWPEDRRGSVVRHELAHIMRRDWLAHFAAQVTCALYWFNPLVWMLARRAAAEAEHACDDWVLLSGVAPTDYAEHLLAVARTLKRRTRIPSGAIAMASKPVIKNRLVAVLDERRRSCQPFVCGWAEWVGAHGSGRSIFEL